MWHEIKIGTQHSLSLSEVLSYVNYDLNVAMQEIRRIVWRELRNKEWIIKYSRLLQ